MDDDAIRELVARASDAQGDPDALIPLHTPDAVIVNFVGRRVLGRDAFEAAMRAALATPLAGVTTTVEIVDVRAVTDSVVIVSCIKTTHDEREDTDKTELPASSGALTYVLKRDGEEWQIALAQTTPILG